MFFETKYGKIGESERAYSEELGMFFETKYGKIQGARGVWEVPVRDVLWNKVW